MIKTRIFKFVGHIHNMQLCIEMISFINHENESILRWFSGLCEPRNFSRILCPVAGCIQTGWGSDLCLPAVVLWNSAPHVSTMLRSNLDLSDSVLDMLHQRVADAREIFGMLNIWTCQQFKIPLWNEFWLKKWIGPRASERARYRVAWSFWRSYRLPNSFLLYYLLMICSPFCCKSARWPFV